MDPVLHFQKRMTDTVKWGLWNKFCDEFQVRDEMVPLLDTIALSAQTMRYGRDQRLVLKRSAAMDNLVIREVKKVLLDFNSHTDKYAGLLYMMCWIRENQVYPLYIGKSEKFGRQGNNLSANIKEIERNQGNFCRWGYNYAYHLGDLSAVVCPGHPAVRQMPKYRTWAERIFQPGTWPSKNPVLCQPLWFWMTAWPTNAVGIWKEYGVTRLTFQEYLLIGLASEVFPDSLLNIEGGVRD